MPYKKVGGVKNASIYAALNLELTSQGAKIVVYATEEYADAEIVLEQEWDRSIRGQTKLSPVETYEEIIPVSAKKYRN